MKASVIDGPSPGDGWLHPSSAHRRRDYLFVSALVLFPCLVFALPALLGHPLIPGDDRFQNFPLRVLSGELLRQGHLPLWDRWIWSGTALLGGFNAGALYPGTLLFAVLSPVTAWTLDELGTFAVGAVGFYALFREQRLSPIAALAGAVPGMFCGMMALSLRHVGTLEAMCWVPWMLLALDRLATSDEMPWLSWALLCFGGGLVLLAGEPRAIANVAITLGIYLIGLVRNSSHRRRLLLSVLAAAPVIVALGAAQLLPGIRFAAASQRGHVPYEYFGILSLDPKALPLQLAPALLGDFEHVSQYSQAQGSGYLGLLPLVAAASFPFWYRSARNAGKGGTWLALVLVGFVLALGENTPLGPWLYRIPFYGSLRFQYLNMAIVDLGLAGLLACWTESVARDRQPLRVRERLVALLPVLGVLGVLAAALVWGDGLQELLVENVRTVLFREVYGYLAWTAALALLVGAFAALRDRLPSRVRVGVLLALVGLDLGLWLWHQDLRQGTVATDELFHPKPAEATKLAELSELLGPAGRYALYDPNRRARPSALLTFLTPDLAGLHRLSSVQGFGSIVDGIYWDRTGSHLTRHLDAAVLAGPLADDLDLRLVLVPRSYLFHRPGDWIPDDPEAEKALVPPHWQEIDGYGDLRLFLNSRVHGHLWVEAAESATPAEIGLVNRGDDDGEIDRVTTAEGGTLVRSVGYADGWSSELQLPDGSVRQSPVVRHDLLQAVPLPAGTVTVRWSYDPPGAKVGLVLTLLTAAVLAALVGFLRRRQPVR